MFLCYTFNSYLGLGLMSARKAILEHHKVDASAFASPCIGSAKAQEWAFSGEKFVVR
jgi:hypothetical protein